MTSRVLLLLLSITLLLFSNILANDQKLSRSAKTPSIQLKVRPASRASSLNYKSYESKSKPNGQRITSKESKSSTLSLSKVVLELGTSFNDEIVDCFDSIMFAESHKERLQSISVVANRHKSKIAILGGGILLKSMLTRKLSKNIAFEMAKTLRDEEAKKWGNRIIGGGL